MQSYNPGQIAKSRLDEERNRFHYNPVANARDLQWSCLTRTRLFDCVGAKFIEYVCACPEIRADFGKIFLKPALESFNRYFVKSTLQRFALLNFFPLSIQI